MKRVYWRPNRISKGVLFLLGLAAVTGTLAIEWIPFQSNATHTSQKKTAAELALRGMHVIRDARIERGHEFDPRFDPANSGMIGEAMSAVTSLPSHLEAKQTSVNPNYAAAVVDMLIDAGVQPGDVVAVGCTGSFPAFNTCVCAALESLGVTPLVIHSAASSQFGANCPDMMWLDMETALYSAGLISFRSAAATLGGFGDRARGMSQESQALLREAIARNGISLLEVSTLRESIDTRMRLYNDLAGGGQIAAYINVGGGAASIHGHQGQDEFGAGLSEESSDNQPDIDCVTSRYAAQGVPVIHLGNALHLARKYGMPVAPKQMPQVGTGDVYTNRLANRLLAGLLLGVIAVFLQTYLWTDFWTRISTRLGVGRSQSPKVFPNDGAATIRRAELMV